MGERTFVQFGICFLSHMLRRRQWHPIPVLLPGKSHGWRSLVGCSPWGCKESDTTSRSLSCTGEGNGNPLHYSCLENPRDGRSWWAAIYGVAQSWTRLKWLSNSKKKGTFHAKMGTIKDRNGTDLTETEDVKKRIHRTIWKRSQWAR